MRRGIVEGEPGIFPAPVARVLTAINRWVRGRLSRRGRQVAPGPPPSPDDDGPDETGLGRDDRYG